MLAVSGIALLPSRSAAESGSPMNTIPVYGTVAAGTFTGSGGNNRVPVTGGTFAGFFSVGSFTVQTNQLRATGSLTGTLALVDNIGSALPFQQVSQNNVVLPVAVGAGASCQSLRLLLGPADVGPLGLTIHAAQAALDLTPQSAPGNRLATPLCNVANLLGGKSPSPSALAAPLQQILQALASVSPLQNIAMVGTTGAGGLIPGTFSISSFMVDPNNPAQLQAVGSFSGIVPNGSGQPTPGTQPLTLPAAVDASSSCNLLLLTVGPLYQNVLGTVAAISPVVLNITAQEGPGNLLCGITSQLGGRDVTALASLLNQIAATLQGGMAGTGGGGGKTIPLSLTTGNGRQFTGSLTLTGFGTALSNLFANARLVGTLTNTAGQNPTSINQPVLTLPVTPGAADCQSLTLELGPATLSVLGSAAYLNVTPLSITAPANANNALETQLCLIANLLNQQPTDFNTLVVRLNQMLNLLP
jgi:hypothetical protein